MVKNLLRAKLQEGRPVFGIAVDFGDPAIVEMSALLGFEWIYLDAEHAGVDVATCYAMVRAADAAGLGSMVRVGGRDSRAVLPFLETGVDAIMFPHVDSLQAAEEAVSQVAYPPLGRRGLDSQTRAADYGLTRSSAEYFTTPELHAIAVALVEDESGFESIEEIAGTSGIEIVDFGLNDLSGSLGVPGNLTDPRIATYRERAIAAVQREEKKLCFAANSPMELENALRARASLIFTSIRSRLVGALREAIVAFEELVSVAELRR
jgi:2-keto-3-deoxy-L-rhamnonate aldolase RhmA